MSKINQKVATFSNLFYKKVMLSFIDVILNKQRFEPFDLIVLILVLVIEILFSADNMLLIGLIIKRLDPKKRQQAIIIGLIGSVLLRVIAIFFVADLIRFPYFQGVGGFYLMYLAIKEMLHTKTPLNTPKPTSPFLKVLGYILFIDLIFSLDSILAAFAIVGVSPIQGDESSKLWIVVLGATLGILVLRSATTKVILWLEKKPILEKLTLVFVFWIGLRLLVESLLTTLQIDFHYNMAPIHTFVKPIFWTVTLLLLVYSLCALRRSK